MKRLKIILLATIFIFLFGLTSQVSAVDWVKPWTVSTYWGSCEDPTHEIGCEVYKLGNYVNGNKKTLHITSLDLQKKLTQFNTKANIPTIAETNGYCLEHYNENLDEKDIKPSDLKYRILINGTNVVVASSSGLQYIQNVDAADAIAYSMSYCDKDAKYVKENLNPLSGNNFRKRASQKCVWAYIQEFSNSLLSKSNNKYKIIRNPQTYESKDKDFLKFKKEVEHYTNYIETYVPPEIIKENSQVVEKGYYYKIGPYNIKYKIYTDLEGKKYNGLTGENSLTFGDWYRKRSKELVSS